MFVKKLFTAGIVGIASLSTISIASADCRIQGGGRDGVVRANDQLSFGQPITGLAKRYRSFTDREWAGVPVTITPGPQCVAYVIGPQGRQNVNASTAADVGSDKFGFACDCKS